MFRIIAQYDDVLAGTSRYFNGNLGLYQGVLGLVVVCLLLIYVAKFFLLNMTILNASEKVHDLMMEAVLHSPSGFFDTTPSGILINKFSNDLGLIDYSLFYSLNHTF